MAGTHIEINHNAGDVLQALNEIIARSMDATPAMAEIASYMDLQVRENFDGEHAPDGTPWAPLSDTTQAFRNAKGVSVDKILHGSLNLRDLIHFSYDNESAEISTGQPTSAYAAMQQFGGTTSPNSMIPGAEIAARPYLGLNDDDRDYILEILGDFLTGG